MAYLDKKQIYISGKEKEERINTIKIKELQRVIDNHKL